MNSLPPILGLSQGSIRGIVAVAIISLMVSCALSALLARARKGEPKC